MGRATPLAAIACALLSACSGDDETPMGSAIDDTPPQDVTPDVPMEVAPPAPPALPMLADWACPSGFARVPLAEDASACAPYEGTAPLRCRDGEARFPGTAACAAIDATCSAARGADLYVRADASPGGDGSGAAPFARLDDALAAAPPGATIGLSEGTYSIAGSLRRDVTLVGACASGTRISLPMVLDPGSTRTHAVVIAAGRVSLRRLSIDGVSLAGSTMTELRASRVRGGDIALLMEDDAQLNAESVIIGDDEGDDAAGVVVRGGRATLAHTAILGAKGVGVAVGFGASFTLTDGVIAYTTSADGRAATGIFTRDQAHVTLQRVAIRETTGAAIEASVGTRVDLTDVAISDIHPEPNSGEGGFGVVALAGAEIHARRLRVERVEQSGILALGEDTTMALDEFVIDDIRTSPGNVPGALGIQSREGASVSLERGVVSRFGAIGVYVYEGALTASDIVVHGGRGDDPSLAHGAFMTTYTSSTMVERAKVDAFGIAIASQRMSTTRFTDLTVVPGENRAPGLVNGRALSVWGGASLEAARVEVTGHSEAALVVTDGHADVVDLAVADTQLEVSGEIGGGGGVLFQNGSTGSVERARLEQSRQYAFVAQDEGTDVRLDDVVAIEPRAIDADGTMGRALYMVAGAHVSLSRALFERAHDTAVMLVEGATVDASDLRVEASGRGESPGSPGLASRASPTCIQLQSGAKGAFDRVELDACPGIGAAAYDAGTELSLVNAHIGGTRPSCEDCEAPSFGFGAATYFGGALSLERFVVDDSARCGLGLDGASSLHLSEGRVVDNPIGVCIETGMVDDALVDTVELRNERNLLSETLPVPIPAVVRETRPENGED